MKSEEREEEKIDERIVKLEKRLEREPDREGLEDIRKTFYEIDKEHLKNKSLPWKARLHWAWIIFSGNAECKIIDLFYKMKSKLLRFGAWLFLGWKR